MPTISTLVVLSLLLIGCSKMPPFPDTIKSHYYVDIKNGVATCVHMDILSLDPYKIGNAKVVDLNECDGVGGYKPADMSELLNWKEDVQDWSSKHCK